MALLTNLWRTNISVYVGVIILGFISIKGHADTIEFNANDSSPYWSNKMALDGMCGEIMHSLSTMIDRDLKIDFQPLKRSMDDDNNNDLGNPEFYIKNQDFAVIIPIALFQNSFHYYMPNHQKALQIDSWDDLIGLKVGILKGGLEEDEFFTKLGIQFEESYTQESLIKKLKLGRLDVVIEIDLVAKHIISQLYPDDVDDFHFIPISDSATPIAMLIDVNYPNAHQLGEQYREALNIMIEDGRYSDIVGKYYGKTGIPDNWFVTMNKYQRLYRFIEVE